VTRPLVEVERREHPPGQGKWDVLACGHREPYMGVDCVKRRCGQCPTVEETSHEYQERLL
jgi:hypothetical protein